MDFAFQMGEVTGRIQSLEQEVRELRQSNGRNEKYVYDKRRSDAIPEFDGKTGWERFSIKVWSVYELEYDFVTEFFRWSKMKADPLEDTDLREFADSYAIDHSELSRLSLDL